MICTKCGKGELQELTGTALTFCPLCSSKLFNTQVWDSKTDKEKKEEMEYLADKGLSDLIPDYVTRGMVMAYINEGIEYRKALYELVRLKIMKDHFGKTVEYDEQQPKAWAEARRLLLLYPGKLFS